MPVNGLCLPGVQLNVALIRYLMSSKNRKNRNYISEQPTNLNNNPKRYQVEKKTKRH